MSWLVSRAGELDFIILDGDGDVRINFLAQLTKRSFTLPGRTSTLTLSGRLTGNLPILDIIVIFSR